jgi:hypothetical protein
MSIQNPYLPGNGASPKALILFRWVFAFLFILNGLISTGLENRNLNISAIVFVAANVFWVVGLEITVRSNRSGKSLFKAYM